MSDPSGRIKPPVPVDLDVGYSAILPGKWVATVATNQNCRNYEGRFRYRFITFVAVQPDGSDQATMPQMKAMNVPFYFLYSGFMYSMRLQSDRQKCEEKSVDPRAFQNHAEIGLFVSGINYTYLIENSKFF